jgi:hypothetical protein
VITGWKPVPLRQKQAGACATGTIFPNKKTPVCYQAGVFLEKSLLDFGYGYRRGRTDFHAALAAQALLFIHRDRFAFLHLKHARGANIDALFVASALVVIDFHLPGH